MRGDMAEGPLVVPVLGRASLRRDSHRVFSKASAPFLTLDTFKNLWLEFLR